MNNICKNCQYLRAEATAKDSKTFPGYYDVSVKFFWCSNSKSPRFRYKNPDSPQVVYVKNACDEFTPKGKKANLFMRLTIRFLTWLKKFTDTDSGIMLIATIASASTTSLLMSWMYIHGGL